MQEAQAIIPREIEVLIEVIQRCVKTFLFLCAGLSLRGGGRGFPPFTMNLAPGYFRRKIEEKYNQKKPLTV